MDRILVNSSNLITVGYDAASKMLEVEFQSGKVYQYMNVPESLYQDLMTSTSKGQFFHDNIMNQYDFTEV
ncbi:MAG TPA: KTSC domain-containing protein [Patescibacteria group bacterium]|nr:KTSC domain-containing protein [Patescibacteria group bacterium]